MTAKRFEFLLALVLCLAGMIATRSLRAGAPPHSADTRGTWSGTFQSKHPNVSPFTMTVLIGPGPSGNLVATTSSAADCFTDANLQVTVEGSRVVLAGSDSEGSNITFRGSLDETATLLNLDYILNGSASGRCESDNGTGNLGKR